MGAHVTRVCANEMIEVFCRRFARRQPRQSLRCRPASSSRRSRNFFAIGHEPFFPAKCRDDSPFWKFIVNILTGTVSIMRAPPGEFAFMVAAEMGLSRSSGDALFRQSDSRARACCRCPRSCSANARLHQRPAELSRYAGGRLFRGRHSLGEKAPGAVWVGARTRRI